MSPEVTEKSLEFAASAARTSADVPLPRPLEPLGKNFELGSTHHTPRSRHHTGTAGTSE
jgi:hypothetical protein